jgi:hypothetical protein
MRMALSRRQRQTIKRRALSAAARIFDLTRFLDANRFPPRIKSGAGFRLKTHLAALSKKDVDGRDEPGHDGRENHFQVVGNSLKMRDALSIILRGASLCDASRSMKPRSSAS